MSYYHDLQKDFFDWLKSKNEKENFTFSVRQLASKGAELNYFIGTEKSNYFSTTFWNIPVAYPGSAGELISLVIDLRGLQNEFKFYIQFNQTKNPDNQQNIYALELIRKIKPRIKKLSSFSFSETSDHSKMEFYKVTAPSTYKTIADAIPDMEEFINVIAPIVDEEIASYKMSEPSFTAERILAADQNYKLSRLKQRLEKFTKGNNEGAFVETIARLNKVSAKNLENYYSILDRLIADTGIIEGDQRLIFSLHKSKKRLHFLIGQRYMWNVQTNSNIFEFMAANQISDEFGEFSDPSPRFLNKTNDFDLVKENYSDLLECAKDQLIRTTKSSYSAHNNEWFAKSVFDINYRNTVLNGGALKSYWLFQGNPDYYDVVGALTHSSITSWKVAAHKDKIKIGDKIILWLTGAASGVYGLGEVTSNVGNAVENEEELSYYKTQYDPNEDRVQIRITHNLFKKPILSDHIKENSILSSLKGGNQGTNFSATQEQFEELIRISQLETTPMNHPLNQILFGCPGSGKTYSTKKLAVEIIENRQIGNTKEDREEILKLYDQYYELKQIRFTTFHQSLGYEVLLKGLNRKL